jgi:hypothetical protein
MGHRVLRTVVTAVVLTAATTVTIGGPAEAAATTHVTAFHLAASPIDLEDPASDRSIRAHIVDSVGIVPGFYDDQSGRGAETETFACVSPVGANNGCYVHAARLVSGTAQDGDWEFDPIGETSLHGTWQIKRLHVVRADDTTADIDPAALGYPTTFRTISRWGAFFAKGSPWVNEDTVLTYGDSLTIRGRAYILDDKSTQYPVGNRRLVVTVQHADTPGRDGTEPVAGTTTTKADGSFAVTVHPDQHAFRYYVELAAGTSDDGIRYMDAITYTGRVDVKVGVWVRSFPASLPARTIGSVEGWTTPLTNWPVYLQRYYNGAWRLVSTATVRSSGRFTLAAQPPKGTWKYRVYEPGDATRFANVTPEFTIKGS